MKLIKSSATSTTVEIRKNRGNQIRGNQLRTSTKIHPTSFLRLSHNVFSQRLSHNVFLTTSFSQRLSQNVFLTTSFSQRFPYIFLVLKTSRYSSNFFLMCQVPKITIFQKIAKITIFETFQK